ncbi:MAG: tripartite tricarboxylate transporter substrate binding protein [Alphaproteobacteria bacterium]|nr:tripartite tricarboxylate transporter substrate binding protein [Alphaproteobacteria bacterium]
MRKIPGLIAGAMFIAFAAFAPAKAQTYPSKPVRVIVSIAAGSVTDVLVRMMDKELAPRLGHPMVIENRGGASGILAAQTCKAAPADGYTLCVIYHSTLSFNPLLFNKLPYDADKDFALITRLFFLIEGLAVSSKSGVTSVADLRAKLSAQPDSFNFGTLGRGSFPELFLTWLNNQWNTKIAAVPYRGGGPVAQALAAGDLQIAKMGVGNFLGLAQAGQVRLLAISAPQRLAQAPDVPTM